MHIMFLDKDEFIIYLNNKRIDQIDFDNRDKMENYFRKLFISLRENYNININGYYNIDLYKDKIYGIILNLEKDDMDYMNYYDNQVEMNIKIISDNFLYEVDDYFFLDNLDNIEIYSYHHKLYLYLKQKISEIEYLKIMEFSKIIYGDLASRILKNGIKIKKN